MLPVLRVVLPQARSFSRQVIQILTQQAVNTLVSVVVGAILGFFASFVKQLVDDRRRNTATRSQIVGLLRVVETRMRVVEAKATPPVEKWVSIELLSDRVFSPDGALLFRADRSATVVYELVAELHQTRAAFERATRLYEELNQVMSTGNHYETGPRLLKQRIEEMQVAGKRGADICVVLRASLKDKSTITTDDSNLGKGFDDLSEMRLAEITAPKNLE